MPCGLFLNKKKKTPPLTSEGRGAGSLVASPSGSSHRISNIGMAVWLHRYALRSVGARRTRRGRAQPSAAKG